ncbi:MAG: glycosyltransferase family 39 protein [Anaerolineae bacterium]|nr:glycosyltransferase family 39 protein [Anaerolineae bacterium]
MRHVPLTRWIVIGLMFFAFGAAAHISREVLERLPRLEDEFAYLYQARIFSGGRVWVERQEPVAVFWQPFLLQPDQSPDGTLRRFGKYPPGWSLVLTLGVWLGQEWLINAFLAMLNIGLVYRLGRELFDETVGVVAALLLAISPTALILNATLMNHTWALSAALCFVYAYWRSTRHGRGIYAWSALSGAAIGALLITRPLTAAAIAAPVVLHIAWRAVSERRLWQRNIAAWALLAACAVPVAAIWLFCNYEWTGNPFANTYTMYWEYDKIGFGEGHGLNRGGHSLTWAFRNMRADLTFWFRDTFGFTLHRDIEAFLREHLGYGFGVGLAWLFMLIGLVAGRKEPWLWLSFSFFVALVISGMFYWIGSVVHGGAVYSVRYYYEGIFGACLVAAYGIVALIRSLPVRALGYAALVAACAGSLIGYTPARLREPLPPNWQNGLYGFNKISRAQIEAVRALRAQLGASDQPVLVIVLRREGERDNWRDYGALLAITDPYLRSDIIVARVFDAEKVPAFQRRFSERLVLYQVGATLYASLADALTPSKQ